MKQLFTILLFFVACIVNGQNYSKAYWGNATTVGGQPSTIRVQGDTLITCSYSDYYWNRIIYRSYNREGNLIDSNAYTWDSTITGIAIRANSLEILGNDQFIATHDFFPHLESSFVKLMKFDKNLDTLKTLVFKPDSLSYNSFDILIEDTSITLIGTKALINNKLSLYIARFDTALNLQWYTTIADFKPFVNQYYNGYYPYRIRRVGNNYYITGRCLYTTKSVEGFLIKTDLHGNKTWDKRYQYQNKNGVDVDITIVGTDSVFTPHYFQSKEISNTPYGKAYFRMMDTSGAILKDTVYPEEEPYFELRQSENINGNLIVVGDFYQGGQKSIVWKLDKNLNTLWRRVYYYGDYEDESWLYNIAQWSDGGIIATGTYFDRYLNPTSKHVYLWLLSLDSNGCLDPNNCGSDIGVLEWALPGQGIKVYPNPAIDYINIKLSLPNLQNTTATVKIYNMAGQVVLEQELHFVDGKAILYLTDTTLPLGGVGGGKPWSGVLELQTETHLFIEKIMIE